MSVLTATGLAQAITGAAIGTDTTGPSPKVWSATRLKTYMTCPRQFHYAYVGLIPSVPTSPLVFGRVLHEVLCFAHEHQMQQGHLPPVPQTLHHFDGLWKRALEEEQPLFRPTAPSPEQHTTIAHEVLRAFLSAQADAKPPLAVELAFEVEAKGHRLCGIIDRVDEGESGLIIVDYKSGSRKPPLQEVERELQFTLYAFAAQEVLGQPVEQVVKCFQEAYELCIASGLDTNAGTNLHNMGEAYTNLGETAKAIEVGEQALALWRNLENNTDDVEAKRDLRRSEGQSLHDLARMYGLSGDNNKAMRLLESSLRISRECGDRLGEARTLSTFGEGYGIEQSWDDSMAAFEASLILFREIGDVMGEVTAMFSLARVWMMTWQFAIALILAREVVTRLEDTQAVVELQGARELVAALEELVNVDLKVGGSYSLPFAFHYS